MRYRTANPEGYNNADNDGDDDRDKQVQAELHLSISSPAAYGIDDASGGCGARLVRWRIQFNPKLTGKFVSAKTSQRPGSAVDQ